jgi:hypothetical protein
MSRGNFFPRTRKSGKEQLEKLRTAQEERMGKEQLGRSRIAAEAKMKAKRNLTQS